MHEGTGVYHIDEHLYMIPGFGLARENMGKHKTLVTIGTRNKAGNLMYPDVYVIKTKQAKQYGTMQANGKRVHKVPFADCKVIQGD